MRWVGHVARVGDRRGIYRVLVGKPEGKRPLGRPRCRWDDNIKMDLQKVLCGGNFMSGPHSGYCPSKILYALLFVPLCAVRLRAES